MIQHTTSSICRQQSPGEVSTHLGFPFRPAESRSGGYLWCCLTLERVTHAPEHHPGYGTLLWAEEMSNSEGRAAFP